MAHLLRLLLPAAMLSVALALPVAGQDTPAGGADQASFFSGIVIELTAESVTVSRTILGKDPEKRSFAIKPDTKIEGKMKHNSRVTVRFATGEGGDVAVSIVVRDKDQKKKP